ncbi:14419_t:CDS:1 [Cetraspora pellucida]|uniref:14419_t:CDS:1 n=1 Tax=Cetraspora pellucida TaxID=1433469 RepID=A0A9N9ETJ1_9GLOM|nr:14419_t:CDS:1 [Cetraspora pellucida]
MKFFATLFHNYSYLFIIFILITALISDTSAVAIDKRKKKEKCVQQLNADDANKLNKFYKTLDIDSDCENGEVACIGKDAAKCDHGKFVLIPCATTLQCFALPLVNKRGTSTTCDTVADKEARFAAAEKCGG